MIKSGNYVVKAFAMVILVAWLSGCEKGPAEKAGKAIDNAAEKTVQQIDKVGDKIDGAVNK